MAIQVQYLAHVAFNVHDMDKSMDFYCGVLGFTKAFSLPRNGKPWIEYLKIAKNRMIELFYPDADSDFATDLTSYHHVCMSVPDIKAAEKALNDAGWPIDIPLKQGGDKNWQLWTHDPDGNKIELLQMDPDSPQAKA
jgi:lactoylglutathione lyase